MRARLCLPALALFLFSPARADERSVSKAPKDSPPAARTQAPAPGAASIVISIDPATGRTRPATPQEINRLMARRAPAATAQPVVVTLPDGTEMMRLDERFHHFASARLTPDGKIESACLHGPDEAEAFAKGAAQKPRTEEK
ncbi:MAG TPA: hypothetical protein VLJ18_09840 [Thermoanaerobaculia bacterium]|nr:hypothetical protein [Thermoanaerobaculia bacterium]